ncbi:hypothetical protein DENSPDRAFT_312822 [Dentipellis sp. KUC8613]|nr:hypothetical protein DENSPDRAFT_312822 [Dentipellis sp. KUC8613]
MEEQLPGVLEFRGRQSLREGQQITKPSAHQPPAARTDSDIQQAAFEFRSPVDGACLRNQEAPISAMFRDTAPRTERDLSVYHLSRDIGVGSGTGVGKEDTRRYADWNGTWNAWAILVPYPCACTISSSAHARRASSPAATPPARCPVDVRI